MAQLIDVKQISKQLQDELKEEVKNLAAAGRHACLAVFHVGDDNGSSVYDNNKKKACSYIGIESRS